MKNEKHFLETILRDVVPIVVYRGCLVERLIGGFKVFNQTVFSAEDVDAVIDGAEKSIENSISKTRNDE